MTTRVYGEMMVFGASCEAGPAAGDHVRGKNDIVGQMQTYYGKRAPVYDRSMGYDNPETVESLAPVIGRMEDLLRGRNVLEIACGPGFWTGIVSEVAESVLATDYNASALDQARNKPLDWDKVSLQAVDAYDLIRVSGCFDAAFAVDWFAHVPRSRFHPFLQGLHGRLGRRARVVFCDQLPRDHSITGPYDEEGNHIQTRELQDGSRYRVVKHYLSDEELRDILRPYSNEIRIVRFPESSRIVVSYVAT